MGARAAEATYLAGAIPVRIVTSAAGVAVALLAAVRLHDVALGGLLIFALNAPSVVAAPLVGALTDAVRSPRRFMLASALLLAAALSLAAFAGAVPLPVVVAALVAGGLAVPVFVGGLSAWVEEAMPGDPARGFAIDALSYNLAGIAGPAIVAGLGVLAGPTGALLVLAASMALGGVMLQLLPIRARSGAADPRSLASGVARATRHLVTHGPLARVVAGGAVVQLGAGMMPVVVLIVAVERGLRESAGGLLLTAFSVGGVAGALLVTVPAVTARLARLPARRVMAAGFAATGVGTLVAAFASSFAAAAVAIGVSGMPDAAAVAAMLRLRQQESPPEVRAQVFVVASGARVGAAAVGAALAGALSGLSGAVLLGIVAAAWLAAFPILLAGRRDRGLDRPARIAA